MKLTDDERRVADDVAWRYAVGGAAFDAAWGLALDWIAARRKALGEAVEAAPATAAGVGAGADDEKPAAWCVVSPKGQSRYTYTQRDHAVDMASGEDSIVPLYRRGTPRGVVVTASQRDAVAAAMREACTYGPLWTHQLSLSDLLKAIDAAKGGAT